MERQRRPAKAGFSPLKVPKASLSRSKQREVMMAKPMIVAVSVLCVAGALCLFTFAARPSAAWVPTVGSQTRTRVFSGAEQIELAKLDGTLRSGPGWSVVKEYPHDRTAFTQGLAVYDGRLYESTGEYGRSGVRVVDLETGAVRASQPLESPDHFGEGIAVSNGTVHQLTWRGSVGFTYDAETLLPRGSYAFKTTTNQGWGMTTDGDSLIVSDGSDVLHFWDPITHTERRRVSVRLPDGRGVARLNELEYYRDTILANVWLEDVILRIDPVTGAVLRAYDFSALYPRPQRKADRVMVEDACLNGIAYDADENAVYLTGKLWPRLYKVVLDDLR